MATVCVAQSFDPLHNGFLPAPDVWQVDVAAADLDGDGDIDFALGGRAWQNQLLINDGEGRFESVVLPWSLGSAEALSIAAADLDGDGDAELMLGTTHDPTGAMDVLLRNDGNLTFTPVSWGGNVLDRTLQIVPVDIDRDGDVDVLNRNAYPNHSCPTCNNPGSRLFRNFRGGLFQAAVFPQPPLPARHMDADVIDYDGDGNLDILFGGTVPQLYLAIANGSFSSVPIVLSGMEENLVADLDNDGDDDLVTVAAGTPSVRRNDGNGNFTLLPLPAVAGSTVRVAAADLDGDGLLDLDVEGDHTHLLRNTGNLVFVDATAVWLQAPRGRNRWPMLHDLDGDGDVDMFSGVTGGRILWNDGAGRLTRLESFDPFLRNGDAIMQAADIDGDGRLDLLGFDDSDNAAWWRGDGFGHVTEVQTFDLWSRDYERSLTPFDADGDGDTDVLLDRRYELRLLRNDGTGNFVDDTAAALPADPRRSGGVEVGDFDRDGDVDLLIVRGAAVQDSYYENDGTGRFVDVGPSRFVDALSTHDFAVADFDGDGDLDVATGSSPTLLFDNDGTGTFVDVTASRMPPIDGTQLIAADVDGDGDPDLVAVTWPGVALLRNDNGAFTDVSGRLPAVTEPRWPQAGDVDADGDLDLMIGNELLVNDGAGTFAVAGPPLQTHHHHYRRHRGLIDLDGDGDADSIRAGIAYSLHRQLEIALPPRVGFQGELRLHARPSVPGFAPVATLLVATGLAAVPLSLGPFGTLRLDPAAAFVHSSHVIPAANGYATVGFRVPGHPAMLGASLWAQALTANGPLQASWRLGNAVQIDVRR